MRMQQRDDRDRYRVTGANLSEALRNVRRIHGDDARIVDSRHAYRRDATGLGRTRVVEVLVAGGDSPDTGTATGGGSRASGVTAAIAAEVERIEEMVGRIEREKRESEPGRDVVVSDYEPAAALAARGAAPETVARLAELYAVSRRNDPGRPRVREHLAATLKAAAAGWTDYAGCHLFLGGSGSGKTDLVLAVAAKLREYGRKVLVLSVAPRHEGEVRRLQHEASRHGYDAAVMKEADQLERGLTYFDRYDAVLVDTPALGGAALADPALRLFVAGNELIHRHLVLPLDRDPADLAASLDAAREWNCDWAAVTRADLTRRPAKLADLAFRLAVPFSLLLSGGWPDGEARIATGEELTALVLGEGQGSDSAAVAAEAS